MSDVEWRDLPEADLESQTVELLPVPFAWVEIPGKGYSIAKYPITNAQYAKFMGANGYQQRRWWTDVGWTAREQGLTFDWNTGGGVAADMPWTEPRFWKGDKFSGAEYPVVGVS